MDEEKKYSELDTPEELAEMKARLEQEVASMGNANAGQERKPSVYEERLNEVSDILKDTNDRLRQLEDRLGLVLGPELPDTEAKSPGPPVDHTPSPLEEAILVVKRGATANHRRLGEFLDRLVM